MAQDFSWSRQVPRYVERLRARCCAAAALLQPHAAFLVERDVAHHAALQVHLPVEAIVHRVMAEAAGERHQRGIELAVTLRPKSVSPERRQGEGGIGTPVRERAALDSSRLQSMPRIAIARVVRD